MADPTRIMSMASAFYDSQVLFTTSDLGIFDLLAKLESADAATIADELKLDPRTTRLLLDGAVALELLEKHDDAYRNTPESAVFLVSSSRASLNRAIRYNRDVYDAWGKLPQLIQSGKPVEKPSLHLGDDATRTTTFVMSMHGRAMGIGQMVIPQLDLSGCQKLLDVGGGPGTYSVLAAQANPELTSTVLDLPDVVVVAAQLIASQGMSERVKTLPGSYHNTPFPAGQDAVFLFGMLHQESPESIVDLLTRAYAALNPGGRVFILDMMTAPCHTQPAFSALFAVNMALTTENGWVFSDQEINSWLSDAGFTQVNVSPMPPPLPHWLASGQKPSQS